MFTGHIQEVGTVVAVDQARIAVRAPKAAASALGWICLNGVGLMIVQTEHETDVLEARLTAETRRRSTLDQIQPGTRVNVEAPSALGDPLGGRYLLDRTPHPHGRRSHDRMAENRRGHGLAGRRLCLRGPRTQNWIIEGGEKHPRQLTTLIGGLLDACLEPTGIDEPVSGPAALQGHPHLGEHLRRRRCWCWEPGAGTSIPPTERNDDVRERQPVPDDRLRLLPPPAPRPPYRRPDRPGPGIRPDGDQRWRRNRLLRAPQPAGHRRGAVHGDDAPASPGLRAGHPGIRRVSPVP
ncbi:hypothetical protein ETD86_37500 [Nonomuraea turkmeniaca]|uniref:Lumazine-binding domain-containing protein n=1 Tax=Nonomuraea turkmeniaca TaxID=103838 RepID=A0A5S4F4V9_9ACTN|nr:hypothetical protein ETD86_37500 [Nonomuraea turkmeniaca]